MKHSADITEQLKLLPQKPGVYMMIDSLEKIIYVGKAKNLKARVSQYFQNQKDRDPKVAEMIRQIDRFDYMVLDTELDAFIEECRLIKELKPRYNRLMKNDRRYVYIKIPVGQFPKVSIANRKDDDGADYFGPFTSPHQAETALQYLKDFYSLPKCTGPGLVKRKSGCLYYQLGTCSGVCTGRVKPEEYQRTIERIKLVLNGDDRTARKELSERLTAAVENREYEKASRFREYDLALRHIIGKQKLVKSSKRNKNILALESLGDHQVKCFLIKGNRLLYREILVLNAADSTILKQTLSELIQTKFAVEDKYTKSLSEQDIDEAQIIYSYLKKHKNRFLSFSIPSAFLHRKNGLLDARVTEIVNRLWSY